MAAIVDLYGPDGWAAGRVSTHKSPSAPSGNGQRHAASPRAVAVVRGRQLHRVVGGRALRRRLAEPAVVLQVPVSDDQEHQDRGDRGGVSHSLWPILVPNGPRTDTQGPLIPDRQ